MNGNAQEAKPTKHTCNGSDGRPLPFGRKAPEGECPRCDELRNGAAPREGWQKDYYERKRRHEAQRSAAIRAHNNDNCPHMRKRTFESVIDGRWITTYDGVCTCFDW
jgi:hypothetical protein